MASFLARRLAQTLPLALLVALLVFSLIHLIPGDPVEMMLGEGSNRSEVETLRRQLGLDRPFHQQAGRYLLGLARGDLGRSLHSGEPVARILARHYPATFELALAGMAVAVAVLGLQFGALLTDLAYAYLDPRIRVR